MRSLVSKFIITRRAVSCFLGALVLLIEVWFLVTSVPRQVEEILTLQKSQEEISKDVEMLDRAVRILVGVDQGKLARELQSVNAVLPSQKKTSGLVVGISKIASDSGVILKELEFSPGRISTDSAQTLDEALPGSLVRRVGAGVTINTDLSGLTAFLSKVQAASQLIGVDTVTFTGSTGLQQTGQIALQVYFEPVSSGLIVWSQVRPVSASEEKVLQTLSATDVFILPGEGR